MISVSAGDYHGGQYLMGGLSALGQGLGEALQRYQQMKDQQTQADMLMATLAQTPDPTEYNPDQAGGGGMSVPGSSGGGAAAAGGPMGMLMAAASGQDTKSGGGSKPKGPRTILDPKSYERYLALSGRNHAAAAAGLMGALQMFHTMQNAAQENAVRRSQVRMNDAHADYYTNRSDPTKELGSFTPRSVNVKTPSGRDIEMIQRSPQQWERIYPPGEWHYNEDLGLYENQDPKSGKMSYIKPEDAAAAQALKPQPTPTPKPSGGGVSGAVRRFFGAKATPTPGQPGGATAGKVHVMSPEGKPGWIPQTQLQAAIAQGYKQIP